MNDIAKARIKAAIEAKSDNLHLSNLKLDYLELPNKGLENITSLSLNTNKLNSLPQNITLLKNLLYIDLSDNSFESFPELLTFLPELIQINFSYNILYDISGNIGKLTNLSDLDLSYNKIIKLNSSICNLKKLEHFEIEYNKLEIIPDRIGNLTKLLSLSFRNNNIETIPDSIGNLNKLVELGLSSNKLTKLPDSLSHLNKLRLLDLDKNFIEKIPENIGLLSRVNTIDISRNKLKELPISICDLKNLNTLYALKNEIEFLPEEFGNLINLHELKLENNKLEKLPNSFTNLSKLINLFINGNRLTELPTGFSKLSNLQSLNISNNNIASFPEELKLISQFNNSLFLDYRGNPFVENALQRSESFVRVWYGIPFHLRDLLKIYFEGFSTFYFQKTQKFIEFDVSNKSDALSFEFIPDNETDPNIVETLLNQYFDILKNKLTETVSVGQIIPKSSSDNADFFAQIQAINFTNNLTHIRSTIEAHISDIQIITKVNDIISEVEDEFRRATYEATELSRQLYHQNINNARLLGESTAIKSENKHHRTAELIRAEIPQTSLSIQQTQSLSFQQTINNHIGDEFYSLKEKLDSFLTSHQKDQADKLNEQIDNITAKTNPTPEEKKTLATGLRRWVESVKKTIAVGKDISEVGGDLLKGWDKVKDFAEKILHDPQLAEAVKDVSEAIQQAM